MGGVALGVPWIPMILEQLRRIRDFVASSDAPTAHLFSGEEGYAQQSKCENILGGCCWVKINLVV